MATVDEIIDNAQTTAEDQIQRMNAKVDEAILIALSAPGDPGFPDGLSPDSPIELELEPPDLTVEQLIEGIDRSKGDIIKAEIDGKFQEFLDTYYPSFAASTARLVTWTQDIINSGGYALPNSVEAAIWDRLRSREDTLNAKTVFEAINSTARRGWATPGGVLTERLFLAQQENTLRQSSASRDIAIEQAKIANDNLKFAVSEAIRIQSDAANAAARFVDQYVRANQLGNDHAAAFANAAVQLYQNTISYYRAFFEQEDLKRRFTAGDTEVEFQTAAKITDALQDRIDTASRTAIEGAKALGDSAASAIGAQNTMAATIEEVVAAATP
jgi:hypothetical protein